MRAFTACLMAVLISVGHAQVTSFERATNSDCISLQPGTADIALFPEPFQVVGDDISSASNQVQVSVQPQGRGCLQATEPPCSGASPWEHVSPAPIPPALQITSAVGFKVDYYNTYKVVTNTIANETYVLVQCGATPPPADAIPAGAKVFQVPLTSLSAPETVPYAFVESLGLDDRVYDVSPFVTSPCGQKISTCGRKGPDAMALDNLTMIESTVGPHVDGMLITAPNNYTKSFSFSAALDPGVLNRAEWIKFLGLFFNVERYASDAFAAVEKAYAATKAAAAGTAAKEQPVVAFIQHFLFEKEESYQLSFAPYKAQLVEDAGGAMLDIATVKAVAGTRPTAYDDNNMEFAWGGEGAKFESQSAALAAFLKVLQGVDVVVDETYAEDPTAYDFAAFQKQFGLDSAEKGVTDALPWLGDKRIFRQDGRLSEGMGSDWFESAIVRPDKVLADFVRALGPISGASNGEFTWIRNIEEAPVVVGPAACSRLASCDAEPAAICPFVSVCADGSSVLQKVGSSGAVDQCQYESCTVAVANTAQMAAPAAVLLALLIVFIEALINWC